MTWFMTSIAVLLTVIVVLVEGCADKSKYCKTWAKSGYCVKSHKYYKYMVKNCMDSCFLCPPPFPSLPPLPTFPPGCSDKGSYCSSYKPYCKDKDYRDYLIGECKLTCNFCHITTAPPPTTKPTQPYTGPAGRTLQPGCGHKGPKNTRIVGGTNAKPGDWPWQVNIDYEKNTGNPGHWCGGTLISEGWVLSAAHCFYDDKVKERYWLKLGEHDIKTKSSHEQPFNITQLYLHPKYNPNGFDYDYALLRLDRNATFNTRVRTACLPGHETKFDIGTQCYISGWGYLREYGQGPAILQQAKVPLVDQAVCKKAYALAGQTVTDRMFCAGYTNGTIDACQGDSGGPLVCKDKDAVTGDETWYLWGSISWGVGCARKGLYGIYATALNARSWIDKIVFN